MPALSAYMSSDHIGEVQIIVAPVDAELGRVNGRFQFMTRSGGSPYYGSAVWTVRNTAFDANTWNNNRQRAGTSITGTMDKMPLPNNDEVGDGLNTAAV